MTASAQCGPDPVFAKAPPLTMAEFGRLKIKGVRATEVKDFTYPGYKGDFKPSPPHADLNPQKAVIISWGKGAQKFVFSHEASYCPWMQMTNGLGLSTQFFEGNNGWAELFNNNGRKTRNSFVDIIQSGPKRSWVRWNYFCVNADDDSKPALRGTEDYIAYPNGLVWRRLSYESLMPDKLEGYSWQPVDFFAAVPPGCVVGKAGAAGRRAWRLPRRRHSRCGVARRNMTCFSAPPGRAGRTPAAAIPAAMVTMPACSASPNRRSVLPWSCRAAGAMPFIIFGNASGFDRSKSQLVDHSFNDTGGVRLGRDGVGPLAGGVDQFPGTHPRNRIPPILTTSAQCRISSSPRR